MRSTHIHFSNIFLSNENASFFFAFLSFSKFLIGPTLCKCFGLSVICPPSDGASRPERHKLFVIFFPNISGIFDNFSPTHIFGFSNFYDLILHPQLIRKNSLWGSPVVRFFNKSRSCAFSKCIRVNQGYDFIDFLFFPSKILLIGVNEKLYGRLLSKKYLNYSNSFVPCSHSPTVPTVPVQISVKICNHIEYVGGVHFYFWCPAINSMRSTGVWLKHSWRPEERRHGTLSKRRRPSLRSEIPFFPW